MKYSKSLDLHGLTWIEALPAFIEFYNTAVQRSAPKPAGQVEIVHGYGSTGVGGILGKRLRTFLNQYPDKAQMHLDENLGHTLITPLAALPEVSDMLTENIVDYCVSPRSQSKIVGKFRRSGEPAVLKSINHLAKQGRLRSEYKGTVKMFEAV